MGMADRIQNLDILVLVP